MYFVLGNFLKSIVKGAAVQIGVSAVTEAVYPKAKAVAKKFLDKAQEQKEQKELQDMIEDSKKRAEEDAEDC